MPRFANPHTIIFEPGVRGYLFARFFYANLQLRGNAAFRQESLEHKCMSQARHGIQVMARGGVHEAGGTANSLNGIERRRGLAWHSQYRLHLMEGTPTETQVSDQQ
jgi:hypothetical protein